LKECRGAHRQPRGQAHELHIRFPSGRSADFPAVEDAAGLAWIANLGCIELHTWHSRVNGVERPDYLLIDLDPSEGNPWEFVREIALVVREVMDELGLVSFPKTSGSTGVHILAPIRPEVRFPGRSATRLPACGAGR
jgi:DNA primase